MQSRSLGTVTSNCYYVVVRLDSQSVTQRRITPKLERTELSKTKYRTDNLLERYRAFFYPRISNAKRVASSGAITTPSALRREIQR